ncbi:MAG: hypothetical protein ACLUSP_02080 [Christensenellales bacterium]
MTAVFTEKEKRRVRRAEKLLTIWFVALGVYLALEAVMITVNIVKVVQYRDRSLYVPFMLTSILLCTLFGSGSLFFFAIKFRLTRKYCRMLRDMKQGLKDKGQGVFIAIDPEISEKDGVFLQNGYRLSADEARRHHHPRGHDRAQPFAAAFETGDVIRFVTHANILMAYEKVGHTEGKVPVLTDKEKAKMSDEVFTERTEEAGSPENNEIATTEDGNE